MLSVVVALENRPNQSADRQDMLVSSTSKLFPTHQSVALQGQTLGLKVTERERERGGELAASAFALAGSSVVK